MSLDFGEKTNDASIFYVKDSTTYELLVTAVYEVASKGLSFTKSVDRSDKIYFPGDPITFTIIINNALGVEISNILFRDPIDSFIVPASGTEFVVTTTHGVIDSKESIIQISGITIPNGSQCTITISGVIASE